LIWAQAALARREHLSGPSDPSTAAAEPGDGPVDAPPWEDTGVGEPEN
jgi:hypothetical protein